MRAWLHLALHFAVPGLVSLTLARDLRWKAWFWMCATMLVDLDHLWAEPVYDPNRCSIGFHPLHSWAIMPLYLALAIWPRSRWLGVGLLIHMALDLIDCIWMTGSCCP